jgi:hypothetical protein
LWVVCQSAGNRRAGISRDLRDLILGGWHG